MYSKRIPGEIHRKFNFFPILILIFTLFLTLAARPGTQKKFKSSDLHFVQRMESNLKRFFKSPGDHHQIDRDIKKIVNAKKEWVVETESKGDKRVLRIKGVIQLRFRLANIDREKIVFNINGQRFIMNPRLSYINHKNRFLTLLNSRQGFLESLFIREVYASSDGSGNKSDAGVIETVKETVNNEVDDAISNPEEIVAGIAFSQFLEYVLNIGGFGANLIYSGGKKVVKLIFNKKYQQCIDGFNNEVMSSFLGYLTRMKATKQEAMMFGVDLHEMKLCLKEKDSLNNLLGKLKDAKFKNHLGEGMRNSLGVHYFQYCGHPGNKREEELRYITEQLRKAVLDGETVRRLMEGTSRNGIWVRIKKKREKFLSKCRKSLLAKIKRQGNELLGRNGISNNCYTMSLCFIAEMFNTSCISDLAGYACVAPEGSGHRVVPSGSRQ